MNFRRAGLLGAAVTFARSARGQKMIGEARQKYDTPANRAKAREAFTNLRNSGQRGQTGRQR